MSIVVPKRTYVPEDLLSLPDDGNTYELVGGRLVEKHVGGFADWVSTRIVRLLGTFGEDLGLGWALAETGYQCFADDPRKVRKPDVSFVRRGRFPEDRVPVGHIRIPPDLAVEVVSPNDTVYAVDAKVTEYLAAGVPLVWVVKPDPRVAIVYRVNCRVEWLTESDELTAPELLPDLRCKVAELFTLPAAPHAR